MVGDPDLAQVAKEWLALSEEGNDRKFLDLTYQYLVFLGDARVKFDMPVGGLSDTPKPMLDYLQTLFRAHRDQVDISHNLETISEFLQRYVHMETGIKLSEKDEALKYVNSRFVPELINMKMREALK